MCRYDVILCGLHFALCTLHFALCRYRAHDAASASQLQLQLQSSHAYYAQYCAKRSGGNINVANQRIQALKDVNAVKETAAALGNVKSAKTTVRSNSANVLRSQRSPRAKTARSRDPAVSEQPAASTPPSEKKVVSTVDHSFVPANRYRCGAAAWR